MKKSLTLLAGASMLVLGVPAISMAQTSTASGPFADVPADHWAYQSVENLQNAGIVIGYPDGTYGGKRAMTRYEFAVAIARLLPLLNKDNNFATKDDLAALRAEVENKLQANASALEDLKKLVNEFQSELQALGQDVTAIKARLSSLEDRVAAVEEEQRRIKFNGALNFIVEGTNQGHGTNAPFRDKNGRLDSTGGVQPKITENIDVYHDFVLAIKGKLSDTATANVKLDFGNYLSAIGNVATPGYAAGGIGFGGIGGGGFGFNQAPGTLTAANQYATVWEAYLSTPVDLGPLGGADIKIGRFGQQYTKYTLKQVDGDVYTSLYQTDSGNIITDGGSVDLKLGPAKVNAFAGKYTAIPFSQPYGGSAAVGGQFRPSGLIAANKAQAFTQGAGVRATFGAPEGGVLGFTVEQFGTAGFGTAVDNGKAYDRLSVYGADFNGALPFFGGNGLLLDANYTVSAEGRGGKFNNVSKGWRNTSMDTQIGATFGAFTVKGGYQYVGPEFTAPGYWGKVGSWSNPTNVQGGVASLKYAFSPALTLNADYEGYKAAYGRTDNGALINSPLQQDDKLTRYQVGLGYGLTSDYNVDFGYERVEYDLKNKNGTLAHSGKPSESFYTVGLGHSFNPNASLKLVYQVVAYRDKGTGFGAAANGQGGNEDGGIAAAQFQLKF
ncbi:MAG: S-layer y domain [Capsulimonas sp.]|nr:S-layer y domain [Capsulimonas sp.]